jgi:hypothetical protein
METFFLFVNSPEEKKKKYCYQRPVLGNSSTNEGDAATVMTSEGDTYFFQMHKSLEDNNRMANKALYKDAIEKKPATIESNMDLVTHSTSTMKNSLTLCGGGKSIFHANFWVDETGNHPTPGTMISFSDVNNFVWKPVDRHQIDYCRYATRELENNNMRLQISHYKRKALLILHPQNDFCDRVPGLYPVHEIDIVDFEGYDVLQSSPAKYNGRVAFQALDPRSPEEGRRRGVVKGFRTRKDGVEERGKEQYYVEVLWDPDVYRPADLLVEDFGPTDSVIRHFRRLQNACTNHLRVHLVSDTRDPAARRYGRLVKVELTNVQVRWDLSVPSYIAKTELLVDADTAVPDSGAFTKGARVMYQTVTQSTHQPAFTIARAVDDAAPIQRMSSTAAASFSTSIRMYGLGTVLNVCENGTHVEVMWDAENTCGNLPVMGSYTDLTYTAKLIRENWESYDEIIISRDCHRCNHISHKSYWQADGGVNDFTVIQYMDVLTGAIVPVQSEFSVSAGSDTVPCCCCAVFDEVLRRVTRSATFGSWRTRADTSTLSGRLTVWWVTTSKWRRNELDRARSTDRAATITSLL